MIIVDVNLLLYAYDSTSKFHDPAKIWWQMVLSSPQTVGIPWATVLAFARITTNHRILDTPLDMQEAVESINSWLQRPMVVVIQPTERHWQLLQRLLVNAQAVANHVPDAHLAALAIEHGATLCSTDKDFARYDELKWINPIG